MENIESIKYLITTLSESDLSDFLFWQKFALHLWISVGLLTNVFYSPLFEFVGVGMDFLGSLKLHMPVWRALVNEMEGTGHFGLGAFEFQCVICYLLFLYTLKCQAMFLIKAKSVWITEWEWCPQTPYTLTWNGYKLWAKNKPILYKVLNVVCVWGGLFVFYPCNST